MRTAIVGTAILAIGILLALPFRRRIETADAGTARPSAAAPHPSVTPLEEVPLDEFEPRHLWPAGARGRAAETAVASSVHARWPQLPESYTEVAVPLAMPQALADRFDATGPLRGHRRTPAHPAPALAYSATPQAATQTPAGWQHGLPLGQPLRGSAALALGPAPSPAPATYPVPATDTTAATSPAPATFMPAVPHEVTIAAADDVSRAAAAAAGTGDAVAIGAKPSTDPAAGNDAVAGARPAIPWLSPEEVAAAAKAQRQATAQRDVAARPVAHALPAEPTTSDQPTMAPSEVPMNTSSDSVDEPPRQRRFIREPVR